MRLLPFIYFFFFISGFTYGQKRIQGHISNAGSPLSNVHVINLSSGDKTASNEQGYYQIKAEPREELEFTYMGMDTISIIVEDVTSILNVKMQQRVEMLNEVVVTKKTSKQKNLAMNYFTDSTIVNTSFGYISPATVAYHLKVIDGSEFIAGSEVLQAIASRRSGIRVGTYSNPATGFSVRTLFMRGMGTVTNRTPALFEVDGNIFTDPPIWLDITMIQRVGIIPGLQAVWRYGHIASGGVIIINTKNGVHGLREENGLKFYDRARLRDNFVTGKVMSNTENGLPNHLKEMQNATSLNETLEIYHKYASLFSNSHNFYLDVYVLLFQKYGQNDADDIIKENFKVFEDNPVWLKALAFLYEFQGRFQKAHEIYKKVYILRPDYAQSFIDMANSYRDIDRPESAASLFMRHSFLLDEGMLPKDSLELPQIMQREIDNLFALENGTLSIRQGKQSDQNGYTTRLVFEWNDSEAEFDLQFVNPNGQYFEWKHTLAEMSERIRSEKKLGYSMVDFLLDDELPGTWKVNATYHGNKQLTPSYLKAIIYRNYGSTLQSKEVKVFRLWIKGTNQYLFDLKLPSEVVHN